MNIGCRAALGALFAVLAFPAVPGHAQPAQSPLVTDTQTTGSWSVRCYRGGPFVCDMTQAAIERANNVRVASISLAYIPKSNSYFGRFVLPLAVSFRQGLGLEIGSFRATKLSYRVCERDGCYVVGMLPPQMISAMQSAGSARGAMTGAFIDGKHFEIPIALDGFSDGLNLLKKWTVAKSAAADESGKK